MSTPPDLPTIGIDNVPINWTWSGLCGDGSVTTTYYRTPAVRAFHAASSVIRAMKPLGFTLAPESHVTLNRHESSRGHTTYDGSVILYFDRERLRIKRPISLNPSANVHSLLVQHGTPLCGTLIAPLAIIGGKGQQKALKARARELVELAHDVLDLVRPHNPTPDDYFSDKAVYVTYLTRGSRGGRFPAVGHRWFSLTDAAAFPPLPVDTIRTHEERPARIENPFLTKSRESQ